MKRSKYSLSICLSICKPHENQSLNSTATGLETEVKNIKANVEEAKTLAEGIAKGSTQDGEESKRIASESHVLASSLQTKMQDLVQDMAEINKAYAAFEKAQRLKKENACASSSPTPPSLSFSLSPSLPPTSLCPGAATENLEMTEKGIMGIVDDSREEAERVEQEIRLNITTMRADIQVVLCDPSSFTDYSRSASLSLSAPSLSRSLSHTLSRSLAVSVSLYLSQAHTTALERVERQSNLAKQKAEDATTQAQEGLREAKASKVLSQAAYALVMHEEKRPCAENAGVSGAHPEAAASPAAGVDGEYMEMPEHSEPTPKIQRGRGRPRKNLDQHQRTEPTSSKKRGHGRPRKQLIAEADSLSHENSNPVDEEARAMSGSSDEQEGVKECLDKCRWLEQLHRDEIEVRCVCVCLCVCVCVCV